MARRNPNTPEPFPWGPKDGETLATAYARRAPGKRPGKEHWHWELSFKDRHGKRKFISLGRLPRGDLWYAITEAMRVAAPSTVFVDTSDIITVIQLLKVNYGHHEDREGTSEALKDVTLRNYKGSVQRLASVVGKTLLRDLDEASVLGFRKALLRRKSNGSRPGYSPKTVRLDIKFLRQAICWGRSMGIDVPDVSVKRALKFTTQKAGEPVNNHHTPTDEDVVRLYQYMKRGKTKLAMYIMWQTGCRVGECAGLRWRDITHAPNGAWISFPKGKTGPRRTPITESAFGEIQSYRPSEARDNDALFSSPAQMSKNTGAAISHACHLRSIEPFTSHGLRRLYTDRCLRAGVDVGTYAAMAGHSPETALREYRKPTEDDMRGALRRITEPDARNLLLWLRQNDMSETEAIRVLEEWIS